MKRLSFVALSLSVLVACGTSSPEASETTESGLVNAPRDTANTWSVGVCASEPNTDPAKGNLGACVVPGTRCSGALVAPNLVLTARHCVQVIDDAPDGKTCSATFGAPIGTSKIRITLDPSVLGENVAWTEVDEVLVGSTNNACKDDIALLRLAADIPGASAKPITLDLRQLGKNQHPSHVAIVGRGSLTALLDLETGAPIDPANGNLTRRFKTDIPWTCVSNDAKRQCKIVDYTSPPTNVYELPWDAQFAFGAGTSFGDSGAAVLSSAKFKKGKKVAIGVNAAVSFDENGVGNHGLAVRLDQHASWLTSTLAAKASGRYHIITAATPAAVANDGEE